MTKIVDLGRIMTSQNIHLPSVGVNCLVAGAYYYIKKGGDQAIASVQYLIFLDSQELQNRTFFENFRDGLGKTYKQSWLSREGHAIYQRWRQ